jgi:hypothetical protein
MHLRRLRFLTLACLLLAIGVQILAPAALGFEAGDAPHLTEAKGIALMRTALVERYPVSWRQARGHDIVCPVGFHARRGGATQEEEIRRRCHFAWSARGYSYRGRGIVWLGGESNGKREWHFQARVVQEHRGRIQVDRIGGTIRP